ncbi:MAG: hypothetical protein B7W98_00045 [Parcubacteria group bacterium 20-58-5]|nr:MAG: hypothetical protein B7W98_00045 [Parcubacteria group bacterium 20-58-5]HQU08166.1 DUF2127 domain-containing protein [Candidatus Paceibacterota bacterium]
MHQESRRERTLHKIFIWGVWLKAFDGVVEVFGGIALLFPGVLMNLAMTLVQNEYIEDPHDFLATHLQHALPAFLAQSGWFVALYLVSHGLIKIVLVAGLLRDKLWAYPSAIIVFGLFIVYQLYRYVFTHSIFLLVLTVLDLVVIWLTWHEYRYFKKYRVFAQ